MTVGERGCRGGAGRGGDERADGSQAGGNHTGSPRVERPERHTGVRRTGALRVLAELAWRELAIRPSLLIRTVLFGALVVATVFHFAAVAPATHFRYAGTFERAGFNATALVFGDAGALCRVIPAVHAAGAETAVTALGQIDYCEGAQPPARLDVTFVISGRRELTYFSSGIALRTHDLGPEAWGVDLATARQHGLGCGDPVSGYVEVSSPDGDVARYEISGVIGTIYAPTAEVSGFIAPAPEWLDEATAATSGLTTTVFIRDADGRDGAAAEALARLNDPDILVTTLADHLGAGARRYESAFNRNIRFSFTWFCVALYAAYFAREQRMRLQRRQKTLAVLLSLGVTPADAARGLGFESAVFTGVLTALGLVIGAWTLGRIDVYVPPDTYLALAVYAVLVNAALLAWGRHQLLRRIRTLPVAALLSESG